MQHSLDRVADLMRWRSAISAALYVAVPAALLTTLVGAGVVWVFAGGFLAVAVYMRRTASPTDSRIGWRIGGLMGVMAATLWLAFEAVYMLLQRYVMHQGAAIDATLRKSLEDAIATMNQQNPAFAHQFPWFTHFWLSPSGIATLFISGSSMLAISMILFSALGGALGGHFLRSRAPHSRAF